MDADGLAAGVLALERAITKNARLRARHPDDPTQFVASEIDVDDKLEALQALAASPELYPRFVELNGLRSVLGLLAHENADVSISAVKLLAELSDSDVLIAPETEAADAEALVAELVKREGLELLVQNLQRLNEDEDEESTGVHLTLKICENLLEFRPELALTLTSKTHILSFLLERVNAKAFDDNKFYAAEVLALLVQTDQENALRVGDELTNFKGEAKSGFEQLLTACARYRKADPAGVDEEECVENLFNALCAALLRPLNKQRFHDIEGPALLARTLKERRFAAGAALRATDFALQGHAGNSVQFVEQGGLKVIFPPFMGRGLYKDKKAAGSAGRSGDARRMAVEHAVSVVSNLVLALSPAPPVEAEGGGGNGEDNEPPAKRAKVEEGTAPVENPAHDVAIFRLVHKFMEKNFEKVDRLCELFFKAEAQLKETERRLARSLEQGLEDEEGAESERLAGGLGQMQQLSVVLGAVYVRSSSCRRQIQAKFHQEQRPLGMVGDVLEHYAAQLAEAAATDPSAGANAKGDPEAEAAAATRRKLLAWASVLG
uniref:Beta-catenin-like protein 1 N-terminal domain-containing protein n=1 Tax=Phaeomonas parva TaxID=124430 RepID=A0A7S1TQT2_9STRA|mmetsp:Transcript_13485/g.39981  ORF Transcript_13485/g.39981 Transcript_13485/m.39981 type:complete len:550 (+) Transcript_13485:109-1758(+)